LLERVDGDYGSKVKHASGSAPKPLRNGPRSNARNVAESIGERGFRRWYERQLIEGFLHLITGVLALIMMSVALEMLEFKATPAGLLALVAVAVVGGGLCVLSWRRFHLLLARSEHLAEQATCSQCNAYGRFTILSSRELVESPAGCSIDVRCRACGKEWTIT
jgi:hypothetical protein